MSAPILYNLFPRLVGPTTRWPEHAGRAAEMGFDWLYLNPWHYPGFSGSLYAVKEYDRLNPLFVPPGTGSRGLEPLREALSEIERRGLRPMMDLVVNHTARDSPLIDEHPEWYLRDPRGEVKSPSVTDPDDPSKVTVWGDLAEIDNEGSPDRAALWEYWAGVVRDAVDLGFHGFRCDAAYMVPAALWRRLIQEAKRLRPDVEFFAETLGASMEAVSSLRGAGFDYFFNSSKWWDFTEPWALEQHERFRSVPSVAFPESHDTDRLAAETDGDEAVQRQRYAFAAAFSAGVMMTTGYEFGFRKRVNVVESMPSDWERRHMDLRAFISRVNALKRGHPLLQGEGVLRPVGELTGETLILERRAGDAPDDLRGWILINKDRTDSRELTLPQSAAGGTHRLHRICLDGSRPEGEEVPRTLALERAEVAYLLPAA